MFNKALGVVVAAVLLVGVSAFAQNVFTNLPAERGYPNLESRLDQLAKAYQAGGMREVENFAHQIAIELIDSSVRVEIAAKTNDKAQIDNIIKAIESLGGTFEISYENLIQAMMPISALEALGALPEVHSVRLPTIPVSPQGSIISEGVRVIGADRWQNAGLKGQGIKIAILGTGFLGYQALLGRELPANVITRTFRADGTMPTRSDHATRSAQIIYDIAPEAQLYLVGFWTLTEYLNAIDWLIQERIDILFLDNVWFLGCYYDNRGRGWLDRRIMERVRQAGLLTVNAAGNYALGHWEGRFQDDDSDGWHNFTSTDETQNITLSVGGIGEADLFIELSWEEDPCWQSVNDFDLYLLDRHGQVVARSENIQQVFGWGSEWVSLSIRLPIEDEFQVQIKGNWVTRPVRLKMFAFVSGPGFSGGVPMEYREPAGSLVEPGISPNVLAVGAVDWRTSELKDYSSRGPAPDGRIKPDMAGPTNVSTIALDGRVRSFGGTSAAAPHAAGASALVKQANPTFTPDQIQQFLEQRAEDLGPPGKDNMFGAGRLNLGPVPAALTAPKPPSELVATALSPTSIELRWKDNSDNEEGFKIERKVKDGEFTQIAQVPANTTSFTDKDLTPATTYVYRVRAFNAAGDSPYSNEASATTPPAVRLVGLRSGEPVRETAEPGPKTLSLTQYTLEVLPGVRQLIVRLRALGNLDLHLRFGKPVEISDGRVLADASSTGPTGLESLELSGEKLQPGTYYIAIENQEGSPQGYVLVGAVAPQIIPVAFDTPVMGQLAAVVQTGSLETVQYLIEVPTDAKRLTIKLENPGVGRFNAYIRFGQTVEVMGGKIIADHAIQVGFEGTATLTLEGDQLKAGRYYLAFENLEPYAQRFTLLASVAR